MRIVKSLADAKPDRDSILTIGAFDGVHLGHQAVLKQLIARAKETNRLSGLVTFQPHPRSVLSSASEPRYLTTLEEKAALVKQIGLDLLAVLPFTTALAATPAQEFVSALYINLRMRELLTGPDFALGRNREGNVSVLREIGKTMGFTVQVIEPVIEGGQAISSTYVRSLVATGQVSEAARWLGRYYSVTGIVVPGVGRGWQLGFPTANLAVSQEKLVPLNGVYPVFAEVNGERHDAVANIGVRPTFDNGRHTIEVHLLDFAGDLHGRIMTVQFVARLRAEMRFERVSDLIAQIQRDCDQARQVLRAAVYMPTPVAYRMDAKREAEDG